MCDDCQSLSRMMTTRQHEVFACLVLGDSDAEIAGRLECSPSTVRRQVARILEVVGVERREDLLCAQAHSRAKTTSSPPPSGRRSASGGGEEPNRDPSGRSMQPA